MIPQPPRRQTRRDIEREIAALRNRARINSRLSGSEIVARMERKLDRLRATQVPDLLARFERGIERLRSEHRRKRRPDDGGLPLPVEPPRSPLPLQGGAAAPLEFDE